MRALLIRSKARDLHDVGFLLHRGSVAPRTPVEERLALYRTDLQDANVPERIQKASRGWDRDLGVLLRVVPPIIPTMTIVKRYPDDLEEE